MNNSETNYNTYIFNSRDIAAYFKWFSVPNYLEVSYMQYIFSLGSVVLAKPLTNDFESFKNEVYKELYYLWANGFENEKSDISNMIRPGSMALICSDACINLESYMKLITLHLIFSTNLPYVNINFTGLPLSLGIKCSFDEYEKNVAVAVKTLNLESFDRFRKPFDLDLGVPDELLSISLNEHYRTILRTNVDFKAMLREEQRQSLEKLKKESLERLEISPDGKRKVPPSVNGEYVRADSNDSNGFSVEKSSYKTNSKNQPKGAPSANS
ncbi:MAG: hypothetical protein MJ153_02530 [Clostridia bacterium]|nr:hypothetical protein [Clostridia bacterium]